MPHPERACEPLLGSDDGKWIFESIFAALKSKTVQNALAQMGYTGVTGVHIGKYIEIDLAPGTDKAAATKALNDAAHKLLSNPVIEDYKMEIE